MLLFTEYFFSEESAPDNHGACEFPHSYYTADGPERQPLMFFHVLMFAVEDHQRLVKAAAA